MLSDFWRLAALNSLFVVFGVMALSLLLAVPAAYLLERSDMPGRRALQRVLTLPYVLPSYLLAMAWITLANPQVGWLNLLAREYLGNNEAIVNIYNIRGVIFVEASALFTVLFLAFSTGLKNLDPALEEAARMSGCSALGSFVRVTVPALRNTLFSGLVVVALGSLASFGVPAMIGQPARSFVLTTGIYALLKEGSQSGFYQALEVAALVAILSLLLVGLSSIFNRKAEASAAGSGRVSRRGTVQLGVWRWPLAGALWLVWGLIVALPLSALLLASVQHESGVLSWDNFSLRAWRYVLFELPGFSTALINSLIASAVSAAIVIVLALAVVLLAWYGKRHRSRLCVLIASGVQHAALMLHSLPGTVLALLLVVLGTLLPQAFTNSLGILVLAYVLQYLLLGLRVVAPAAQQLHPSLIEAAELGGAGFWSRLRRVWFPLLRPALGAAALLVLLPCLSELTKTLLLYGPGTETLGVALFHLQEYADRASAAVLGTLLLIAVVGAQLLMPQGDRRYGA